MMPALWARQRRRRRNFSFATSDAEAAWKVSQYSGSGQLLDLTGRGHHATLGSAAGADANDPLFLTLVAGKPWLYLPGIAANYASVPDAAALDIVGDISLRAQLNSWVLGSTTSLLGKWAAAQRSYRVDVNGTGVISMVWTTDGSTAIVRSSTANIAGGSKYVRSDLDVNNGAAGHTVWFYESADGSVWTPVGVPVVTAGITSIFSGTSVVVVGGTDGGTSQMFTGNILRAQIFASIDGSAKVLDIDFTDLAAYNATRTSLTAVTGQTVTINRAATGLKSSVVDRPLLLLGTNKYLEVPDDAGLDFAAADSFTVVFAWRRYGYPAGTTSVLMSKRASNATTAATAGWGVTIPSGDSSARLQIDDGTNITQRLSANLTPGNAEVLAFVRNVAADTLTAYVSGVAGATTTDTTTGTLANSDALRIGRAAGGVTGYMDMEFIGAAIYRRAVSAAELAAAGAELLRT